MTGPQTPLSATLGAQGAADGLPGGACSCGVSRLSECTCPWGDMIRKLIKVGYELTPLEAVHALSTLGTECQGVMAVQRRGLVRRITKYWEGSREDLLSVLKMSRYIFLRINQG